MYAERAALRARIDGVIRSKAEALERAVTQLKAETAQQEEAQGVGGES